MSRLQRARERKARIAAARAAIQEPMRVTPHGLACVQTEGFAKAMSHMKHDPALSEDAAADFYTAFVLCSDEERFTAVPVDENGDHSQAVIDFMNAHADLIKRVIEAALAKGIPCECHTQEEA